jgi:hypothetical protein
MAIGGMEIVYFSLLQLKHGSIGYSHGCTDVRGSYFTVRGATTMGTATGSPSSVHCSSSQTSGLLVFIISPVTPALLVFIISDLRHWPSCSSHLRHQVSHCSSSHTLGLPLLIISDTGSQSVQEDLWDTGHWVSSKHSSPQTALLSLLVFFIISDIRSPQPRSCSSFHIRYPSGLHHHPVATSL